MTQHFILPKLAAREGAIERITRILGTLSHECAWRIEVHEHKPTRSHAQNRLLWSLYEEIIKRGGEQMQGWDKEDLHTFFLCNHFGSEVRELFGRKRHIPLRTSSKLSKMEFVDLIESIVRFMAERGVVLDMPDDVEKAA